MVTSGSRKTIFAALAANALIAVTLIAVTQFAAVSHTGSAAMLSEAIHSLVETGNQGLLLRGTNSRSIFARTGSDGSDP